MIRRAEAGDHGAVQAFLAQHRASSMFLLSNLAAHGIAGSDHPYATEFYLEPGQGPLRAVFGRTRSGMLLCQVPGQAPLPDVPFAAFAEALRGSTVIGASGEAEQIDRLLAALTAVGTLTCRINHLEPLFSLVLADLPALSLDGLALRAPLPADAALLTMWFERHLRETGFATSQQSARSEASARTAAAVEGGPVRLLCDGQTPVAMAALNARTDDAVQVGGVFVPPDRRNRGLGRRVVAALLRQAARQDGATQAFLFSNNDAASAAYRSIGFQRVGMYRIALFEPFVVAAGGTPR